MRKHLIKRSIIWMMVFSILLPLVPKMEVEAAKAEDVAEAEIKKEIEKTVGDYDSKVYVTAYQNNATDLSHLYDMYMGITGKTEINSPSKLVSGWNSVSDTNDKGQIGYVEFVQAKQFIGKSVKELFNNYIVTSEGDSWFKNFNDHQILHSVGFYGCDPHTVKSNGDAKGLTVATTGVAAYAINKETASINTLLCFKYQDVTARNQVGAVGLVITGLVPINGNIFKILAETVATFNASVFDGNGSDVTLSNIDGAFKADMLDTLSDESKFGELHRTITDSIHNYIFSGKEDDVFKNLKYWETLATFKADSYGEDMQSLMGTVTPGDVNSSSSPQGVKFTVGGDSNDTYVVGEDGSLSGQFGSVEGSYAEFPNKIWNSIVQKGFPSDMVEKVVSNGGVISSPKGYILQLINELAKVSCNLALHQTLESTPIGTQMAPTVIEPYNAFNIAQYMLQLSIYAIADGEDMSSYESYICSDTDKSKVYKVKADPNTAGDISFYDNWNQLTEYQKASLSMVYSNRIIHAMDDGGRSGSVSDYAFTGPLQIDDNGKIKDLSLIYGHDANSDSISGIYDLGTVLEDDLKAFRKSSYTASGTAIDSARYADLIGTYAFYHAMVHREGESTYTTAELDGTDLYDATIETLGTDIWKHDEANLAIQVQDKVQYVPVPPSVMGLTQPNYMFVEAETGASGDRYFQMLQRALFAISYAFEVTAKSDFGTECGYTPETLLAYFEGTRDSIPQTTRDRYDAIFGFILGTSAGTQMQVEEAATTTDFGAEGTISIWMFKCIIELYDLCEHLQINPAEWSPTINAYYKIYQSQPELFEALRKNPIVMGQGYDGKVNVENPLGRFFGQSGSNSIETSIAWNKGFAMSASYVPFSTNIYDSSLYEDSINSDQDWLLNFFYRYGFHRKALYISTDPSIVVNNAIGRTSTNGMKIATLEDLLNYDRDIILYIDEDFYNADVIKEALGKTDYTTIRSNIEATERARAEAASTKNNNATQNESESNAAVDDSANQVYEYDKNYIDEVLNLNVDSILKSNGVKSYSTEIAANITQLGSGTKVEERMYDAYILSSDSIIGNNNVIDLYEYSPITAYGVISAIYRDVDMFNMVQSSDSSKSVVLESSKAILNTPGTKPSDWYPFYNYIMVSGIKDMMNINTDSKLDIEAPIFIDIFGNIVTESGYVIIPAAANATLCGKSWSPYTMAFAYYTKDSVMDRNLSSYSDEVVQWLTGDASYSSLSTEALDQNDDGKVTTTDLNKLYDIREASIFVANKGDGKLHLKNCMVTSHNVTALVQWNTINANSTIVQQLFYADAYYNKARDLCMHNSTKILNLILEVLRGAPLENINYAKEGIRNDSASKIDIVGAWALDGFVNALSFEDSSGINTALTMPNLFFMDYLDYVAYFSVKIAVALLIAVLFKKLYQAGVKNSFGIGSVIGSAFTVAIVLSAVYVMPNSVSYSYDIGNATMLSEEAVDIMLYDAIRNSNGQEITVTDVQQINSNTELLMEVGAPALDWKKLLGEALLSNGYKSFNDMFEDAAKDSPLSEYDMVKRKGSKLYISTDDILNSTVITYDKHTNMLTNSLITGQTGQDHALVGANAVYSFVSPYYVFLDQLVANINEFNNTHDVQSFTFSVDQNGMVQTYDLAGAYFRNGEFLIDGYDILGLHRILECTTIPPMNVYIFDEMSDGEEIYENTNDILAPGGKVPQGQGFNESNFDRMKLSEWWRGELDNETKMAKIDEVYSYVRTWVSEHQNVIKRIPDEMFIKAVAFAAAVKYNDVFNNPHADTIRLMSVDNRDMLRFMVSDFDGVYFDYPYSFGRFVLSQTDIVGVFLSAILVLVLFICNVLKPALIAILFIIILINILFRKLLFDRESNAVLGYLMGCALFIVCNVCYSMLMKVAFSIPSTSAPVVVAIIVAILVQLAYLALLILMIYWQVKDWKDSGYNAYTNVASSIMGMIPNFGNKFGTRYHGATGGSDVRYSDSDRRHHSNKHHHTFGVHLEKDKDDYDDVDGQPTHTYDYMRNANRRERSARENNF